MIKVRVQGLPEEVEAWCDELERRGGVLERSDPYPNRGRSKFVRVYLELEYPEIKEGE